VGPRTFTSTKAAAKVLPYQNSNFGVFARYFRAQKFFSTPSITAVPHFSIDSFINSFSIWVDWLCQKYVPSGTPTNPFDKTRDQCAHPIVKCLLCCVSVDKEQAPFVRTRMFCLRPLIVPPREILPSAVPLFELPKNRPSIGCGHGHQEIKSTCAWIPAIASDLNGNSRFA